MLKTEDIQNIEIRNIILLDKDRAGDLYMEKVFPLWTDVIVVTLEGKYPVNADLRNRVMQELKDNPNLFCMTFGANSDSYPLKTQKRFKMAYFLLRDIRNYDHHFSEFNFDEELLVSIMMSLTESPVMAGNLIRVNQYDHLLNSVIPESVNWIHSLIKSN